MNILIVPSWYEARPGAQLGSFFREQALALKRSGCNVTVADATFQSMKSLKGIKLFSIQKKDDEGLLTYSYLMPSFGLMRMPKIGAKVYAKNLERLLRSIIKDGHKIDIIHAHSFYFAGVAATRLGKKYGIPVVVTEHASIIISKKLNEHKTVLLKETVEKCEKFICVGNGLKNAVIEYTQSAKNIAVIPNMVDKIFNYKEEKGSDTFFFTSIGNLIQSKRFDLTIKAFARIFRDNHNVMLTIIGDGPLKDELKTLAKEQRVETQVIFTGRIDRNRVAQELQSSNAFVLASDYETFGVAYIEAMACGNPVIGTRNGGADGIINDDCGILVNTNDELQLAGAMKQLYSTYKSYDKKYISDQCDSKYGEKAISTQLKVVYSNIVKSGECDDACLNEEN